ncbi:hypothetical protein LK533_08850 [Sphingomonas sp. PL-96]|uniref:cellulose biosynthesis protein BcsD n=1 Tax=Sphingomonas sp. PL-96 TaxID=2887201 RepID=UPI001E520B16|nr:hypothetical protein [Sphingomonas sp. PL-96]MCC2976779.1 hypothetical protein [Sphingomonas sp. PL-96]
MSKPMLVPWRLDVPESELQPPVMLACHMVDEAWEMAGPEQAQAFFRAIGNRIARAYPLGELRSNDEIFAAMNAFWAESGWGRAVLRFTEDGLRIVHAALPLTPPEVERGRWRDTVVAVVAGIYDYWLGQLGGSDAIKTRVVATSERSVEFVYGA